MGKYSPPSQYSPSTCSTQYQVFPTIPILPQYLLHTWASIPHHPNTPPVPAPHSTMYSPPSQYSPSTCSTQYQVFPTFPILPQYLLHTVSSILHHPNTPPVPAPHST